MQFEINSIDHTPITDRELTDLLKTVYVDDGFTSPELAQRLFEPSAVRKRGRIFTARNPQNNLLAGMIIAVPSSSKIVAHFAYANMCSRFGCYDYTG